MYAGSLVVCLLLAAGAARGDADAEARRILEATGVRGGLVVHVGCGDGSLTAALGANEGFLVHGLGRDPAKLAAARRHVREKGLYGKVTVAPWAGRRLPHIDGLVNLVACKDLGELPMAEVLRVLAPGGVAYVRSDGVWKRTVKPRPGDIDEWTHFLHDATNNAVADDARIGPPKHMQWLGGPLWGRHHHHLASISAVVTAGGRLFAIADEGSTASIRAPGRWVLHARDAFSGVLLWTRTMGPWANHTRGFRSGPVQLPRTLVADGQAVYAPLGIESPLTALDAATGKVLRTYAQTTGTEEVLLDDGMLLVLVGAPMAEQAAVDPTRRGQAVYPNTKTIRAFEAATGKALWQRSAQAAGQPVPVTLAASPEGVFFQTSQAVVCLDRRTGKPRWTAPTAQPAKPAAPKAPAKAGKKPRRKRKPRNSRSVGWAVSTLVVRDGVVLLAADGKLRALAADEGKPLWNCAARPGFRSASDVFVIGGKVYLAPTFAQPRDLRTGIVHPRKDVIADLQTAGHHHRCYREKATSRYILTGHRGVEFLDLAGENHVRCNWIRGVCQYGIMPANGLLYAPPHICGCLMEAKIFGFWAVRPSGPSGNDDGGGIQRLRKGPAYPKAAEAPAGGKPTPGWPTLRGDVRRSGSAATAVGKIEDLWQAKLPGRGTPPVVAGGTVIVSAIDAQQVVALDVGNGARRWAFTSEGRVDSAPTIHDGRVLFGCTGGWVYCLRLADGQEAWRHLAAPGEELAVAMERVESLWPVHGSVLVQNGTAYAAAGRSSYLDGGIRLVALDVRTGRCLARRRVRSEHPKAGEGKDRQGEFPRQAIAQNATDYKTFTASDHSDAFSMDGATNDVLVGDGRDVFLRQLRFDAALKPQPKAPHLMSTSRLITDGEVHRSHWFLGTGDFSRIPVAYSWIVYAPTRWPWRLSVPHGLLLTFDAKTVWGVRRAKARGGMGYLLFAEDNRSAVEAQAPPLPDFRKTDRAKPVRFRWSAPLDLRPRAMIRAGESLLLSGWSGVGDASDPAGAFEGRAPAVLRRVSTADGTTQAERPLPAAPVWDGLATAGGRVYVTTVDGRVLCLGPR